MNYVPPPQQPPYGAPFQQSARRTSTNAIVSLIMGILSFVICPVLGVAALYFAAEANKEIALDPSVDGAQLATAGKILGIIALVLIALAAVAFIVLLAAGVASA